MCPTDTLRFLFFFFFYTLDLISKEFEYIYIYVCMYIHHLVTKRSVAQRYKMDGCEKDGRCKVQQKKKYAERNKGSYRQAHTLYTWVITTTIETSSICFWNI